MHLCKLPFSSVVSMHRRLAGLKAVAISSLQALLRVKSGKRSLSKGSPVSRLLTPWHNNVICDLKTSLLVFKFLLGLNNHHQFPLYHQLHEGEGELPPTVPPEPKWDLQ